MSNVVYAVLAAGKSTRVADLIGGRNKAEVVVDYDGRTEPMVCHKLRFAGEVVSFLEDMGYSGKVVLVVGYRDVAVIETAFNCDLPRDFDIVWDKKIEGIAMAWKQVAEHYGYNFDYLVSDNVDDLRPLNIAGWLARNMASAIYTDKDGLLLGMFATEFNRKSVLMVNDMDYLISVKEGLSGENEIIGVGWYMLKSNWLKTVEPERRDSGEYEPDIVINKIVEHGGKIKVIYTSPTKWFDAGVPEGLSEIMVSRK